MRIRQCLTISDRFLVRSISGNGIFSHGVDNCRSICILREIAVGHSIRVIPVIRYSRCQSGHFRITAIQMKRCCKALCARPKTIPVIAVIPDLRYSHAGLSRGIAVRDVITFNRGAVVCNRFFGNCIDNLFPILVLRQTSKGIGPASCQFLYHPQAGSQ